MKGDMEEAVNILIVLSVITGVLIVLLRTSLSSEVLMAAVMLIDVMLALMGVVIYKYRHVLN